MYQKPMKIGSANNILQSTAEALHRLALHSPIIESCLLAFHIAGPVSNVCVPRSLTTLHSSCFL